MAALSADLSPLAEQIHGQEAAIERQIAALNATGEAALSLADARTTSNACRDALAQLRSTIDSFELALATDQALEPDSPPVVAATGELQRTRTAHDRLRATVRDASLVAFRMSREAAAKERDALLTTSGGGAADRGAMSAQQAAAEATSSLRRTRALMAAELGRGEATMQVQSSSFAALRRTKDEFESQRATLGRGKKSLSTLTRAAHADRIVLWAGSIFFCLVVIHIALKRVPFLTPLHPLVIARRMRGAPTSSKHVPQALPPLPPPSVPISPPPPPPPPVLEPNTVPEAHADPAASATAESESSLPQWAAAPEPEEAKADDSVPTRDGEL